MKARSLVVSRESWQGAKRCTQEKNRGWEREAKLVGDWTFLWISRISARSAKNAHMRQPEKCESARAHQVVRAELP